jgi:hypothetical protein
MQQPSSIGDVAKIRAGMDVDQLRFDTVTRSLALVRNRRAALAAIAALGLGGVETVASKKKRSKKKPKKNKCTSGPCTYNQCLLYVKDLCSDYPSISQNACVVTFNGCCDKYASVLQDKAYRNAVLRCI